jgi:hypothetical protein
MATHLASRRAARNALLASFSAGVFFGITAPLPLWCRAPYGKLESQFFRSEVDAGSLDWV